ncbi:hypothetical protein [Acaryochloris sp. CCMEE 5410]|uniref:hypothetical protein n=1 Tax=Acaryochloris sp. CCMEE 5410 TaxID=310037 RepID=UPI00024852A3|nr:hypothetical protein [Acaryochloris sp. CCMEE 5410]KAI9135181.1 hypothetical protein ON05_019375 [Acaryochloris sp. CCMEE 5410]
MAEHYLLISDDVPLAQFESEESDMWYLFGKIAPIPSGKVAIHKIFSVTKHLEFKAVLCDWSQGYRCDLQAGTSIIPCVLMECNPQQVILRMLTASETIAWSKQHLRPLSISEF